jgi:hypothetical protein
MNELLDAKKRGDKVVIINGFKESIEYAMSLSNLKYVEEIKSDCGYSTIKCFTS